MGTHSLARTPLLMAIEQVRDQLLEADRALDAAEPQRRPRLR